MKKTVSKSAVMRRDAVPLYHQIFLTLRDEIVNGSRALGSAMPTEFELAAEYSVSRITARRALDELAEKGFVERKRRTGTRVIFRGHTVPIDANLEQAVESLLAFGRNTKVRVLEVLEEPADASAASALGLGEGSAIIVARRLRYLDDAPLGHVVSQVPLRFAGNVTAEGLSATPILALLRDGGNRIGGGHQTISALAADPALAAALATEQRAVVLQVERIVTNTDGVPILRTIAQYRGDRYRLSLDLHGSV